MNITVPTPYPELNQVLSELTERARAVLGENFVAAYLQGSFAVGDFDEHSDVDFLVVTETDVSGAQLTGLQAMHADIFDRGPEWARHLEGSYLPRPLANRAESLGVELLWYIDNGSRTLVRSVHDNTWVVRWVVRERGISLAGPEPKALFAPVSPDSLRAEVLQTMRDWGESLLAEPERMNNRWYQPFAVISYCRMLQTLETGTVESKPAGVRWGRTHLEPRWSGLIARAWAGRPDPSAKARQPADPVDLTLTGEFIRHAVRLAERREAGIAQYAGAKGAPAEGNQGEHDHGTTRPQAP